MTTRITAAASLGLAPRLPGRTNHIHLKVRVDGRATERGYEPGRGRA